MVEQAEGNPTGEVMVGEQDEEQSIAESAGQNSAAASASELDMGFLDEPRITQPTRFANIPPPLPRSLTPSPPPHPILARTAAVSPAEFYTPLPAPAGSSQQSSPSPSLRESRGRGMRRSIQFLSIKPPQNSEQNTGEVDNSDQETPTPQAESQFFPVSEMQGLRAATAQIPVINVSMGQNEFFPDEPQPSTSSHRPLDPHQLYADQGHLRTKIKTTRARDRASSANAIYPRTKVERALNARESQKELRTEQLTTGTRYRGLDGKFKKKAYSDDDR